MSMQRASQIRSMPFTGDSSDDSSDGEDHAVMLTHNSHNSSSTDNTETSTSGSASSPSKSCKTSSSLSPAKRSGSESPKNTKARGKFFLTEKIVQFPFRKKMLGNLISLTSNPNCLRS